jgi:hypothetical protein
MGASFDCGEFGRITGSVVGGGEISFNTETVSAALPYSNIEIFMPFNFHFYCTFDI